MMDSCSNQIHTNINICEALNLHSVVAPITVIIQTALTESGKHKSASVRWNLEEIYEHLPANK